MSLIAPLVKKKKGQAAFEVGESAANVGRPPQKMCTCAQFPPQQCYNSVLPGNYNMAEQQNQFGNSMNQPQMPHSNGQFYQPPRRYPCSLHPQHNIYK